MMVAIAPAHLVGTGGAIGAILRHYVTQKTDVERFPFGTLSVNVLGTFVLGLVVFLSSNDSILLFLGTGVCGSFMTFSSFSVETVQLWEAGDRIRATANALLNLIGAATALAIAQVITILIA
jgi:CrcB protein